MFKFVVTKNVKELFHRAVVCNDLARVRLLLEQASQDPKFHIDTLSDEGLTALQLSCFAGNIELVKLLVSHGANVKIKDCHGWSLLHGAALGGKLDIARFLIQQGCRCSSKNDNGEQPIDLATDLAMIVLLLKTMLEEKQNTAVQQYMKRNPKLKRKIAKEIQTAIELENNEGLFLEDRSHSHHHSHGRKLPGITEGIHSEYGAGHRKAQVGRTLDGRTLARSSQSDSLLVGSSSCHDLKVVASEQPSFRQHLEDSLGKYRTTLQQLTGTSHSYCPRTDAYYEPEERHRAMTHGHATRSRKKNESRSQSSSSLQDSLLTRRGSDLSSLSSFSDRSDAQRPGRVSPDYASIDHSSRRSRSGDSDSSSHSDKAVTKRTRVNGHSRQEEEGKERLKNSDPIYASIKEIEDERLDDPYGRDSHHLGYPEGGATFNGRKQSLASDHSSNFDSQEAPERTQPLYENIPNDVLLSIILANRLSDNKNRKSAANRSRPLPHIQLNGDPLIDASTRPGQGSQNDNDHETTVHPLRSVNRGPPIEYENNNVYQSNVEFSGQESEDPFLKTFIAPPQGYGSDSDSSEPVLPNDIGLAAPTQHVIEKSYEVDSSSIHQAFRPYEDGPIYENLRDRNLYDMESNINGWHEDRFYNGDNVNVRVEKDKGEHSKMKPPSNKVIFGPPVRKTSGSRSSSEPMYVNMTHAHGGFNSGEQEQKLQNHIKKHLTKHGLHSASVGSLPNDYFKQSRKSEAQFHDDMFIGKQAPNHYKTQDRVKEEGEDSTFRVFQLVKVEYPEVFV